ncbi:SGNH/GDSL hydrolase family protein [Arthrobacter sp. ISL-48]|uniref:SGNH/GDSL hydrolase family protein n=1 Tax=Arthrobacter sp. ISL-48 TaxID=2819110 RepID=UPI001BE83FD9|nr:SGNH/GDSL hydrolase family protein [Arthrobacter sp. ISL-48]MBT2533280.1 SGNH/GDSL hydrolase family protein [Arthrobacter sp. ISL-48]
MRISLPPRARRRLLATVGAVTVLLMAASARAGQPLPGVTAVRVVVVGDSLSTGHGTSPGEAWPALMRTDPVGAGFQVLNAAEDGSGYLSPGYYGGTFGTEAEQFVTADTGIVVFFGSENDLGYAAGGVAEAASAAITRVEALAPAAKIIVVGPPSYSTDPDPGLLDISGQLESAARGAGAKFVDPIEEGWISNDVEDLIGPDGDHPTIAGQRYLLEHMIPVIDQASSASSGESADIFADPLQGTTSMDIGERPAD